jgi:hypothetical protein
MGMAWVKVPPENRPLFLAALPDDARVEAVQMFGGVAAKVNGHLFAGLFGRSTIVWLPEPERAEALALEGATMFDPMGDGRMRSDKVMLPESVMHDPDSLRIWIARAFDAAAMLPKKAAKAARAARTPEKSVGSKKAAAKRGASKPSAKRGARRG